MGTEKYIKTQNLIKTAIKEKERRDNAISIFKNDELYWKNIRKIARTFLEEVENTIPSEHELDKMILLINKDEFYLEKRFLKTA